VLQLVAAPDCGADVMQALSAHACDQRAISVSGRCDPSWLKVYGAAGCTLQVRDRWMLVHARDPELVECFDRGRAALSRLDGEWSFAPGLEPVRIV
jgi:hypothetical protein